MGGGGGRGCSAERGLCPNVQAHTRAGSPFPLQLPCCFFITSLSTRTQKKMKSPTQHCPSAGQGGQGLSVLQRGQPPGGQKGAREGTTLPPGTGASFQWFPLICTHWCRHSHATVPLGGAHLVFNVPQHVATCKKEGTLAFIFDLAQDNIRPRATPTWEQCHHSSPFKVHNLGGWGQYTFMDLRVESDGW